jgi:two-component system, OmpR family, sensor kinase
MVTSGDDGGDGCPIMLALARHEGLPSGPAEMPLAALDRAAKEVVADLLPEATDRGIDFGFALVEPLTVHSEAAMLTAVIRNLLDNALRFTPGAEQSISEFIERILQVEDTGPGHRIDRHG